MSAHFVDWLGTGDAGRLSRDYVWSAASPDAFSFTPGHESEELLELAQDANSTLAETLRSQDPIWCDPNMTDLLAVAAAELPPSEHVEPWHFLYPSAGLVVFAKPLPTEWHNLSILRNGTTEQTPHIAQEISAISWEQPLADGWIIRTWGRAAGSRVDNLPDGGKFRSSDLRPLPIFESVSPGTAPASATRVLMALTGLVRTATTVAESTEAASKAARKEAKRARMADRQVRRLYLRHPDAGAAEIEALRHERQGTPRGHWVRGHWRHQWYASIQDHRWQWVDGYPRGDFAKGTVSGDRIQIARAGSGEAPPS